MRLCVVAVLLTSIRRLFYFRFRSLSFVVFGFSWSLSQGSRWQTRLKMRRRRSPKISSSPNIKWLLRLLTVVSISSHVISACGNNKMGSHWVWSALEMLVAQAARALRLSFPLVQCSVLGARRGLAMALNRNRKFYSFILKTNRCTCLLKLFVIIIFNLSLFRRHMLVSLY